MRNLCLCVAVFLLYSCQKDRSQMVVDGSKEPAYVCDAKHQKSLGGIDSNQDGVRDDIERLINREYQGESKFKFRSAWKAYARAIRKLILSHSSNDLADILIEQKRSEKCLQMIYREGKKEELASFDTTIKKLSVNSRDRLTAYIEVDRKLASIEVDIGKAVCNLGE